MSHSLRECDKNEEMHQEFVAVCTCMYACVNAHVYMLVWTHMYACLCEHKGQHIQMEETIGQI